MCFDLNRRWTVVKSDNKQQSDNFESHEQYWLKHPYTGLLVVISLLAVAADLH